MVSQETYPYIVYFTRDRYPQVQTMIDWCFNQFGPSVDDRWSLSTAFGESRWLFKNQSDATMFALRWG